MNNLLKAVGLTTLVPVLPRLLEEAQRTQPTYAAFLQQTLEVEAAGRAERARERRVRAAHLPVAKTLEAFDFTFQPTVSERLMRELAELTFVQTATNLIFLGPPGVGKTHEGLRLSAQSRGSGLLGALHHPGPVGRGSPRRAGLVLAAAVASLPPTAGPGDR